MMKFGTVLIEGNDEVAHCYLEFDSGKKLIISAEEGKEVEVKLKMVRAEGKSAGFEEKEKALNTLLRIFDWVNLAPIGELQAVQDAIEWDFPIGDLVAVLGKLEGKTITDLHTESFVRNKARV